MKTIDKADFSVVKTQCELYKIRYKTGSYWADITIDHNGETGRIQIASDYGNWQYYWGSCGRPFKEFLISLPFEYTAEKFGVSQWFNVDATMDEIKDAILNSKMRGNIDDHQERQLYRELSDLGDCRTINNYEYRIYNNDIFWKIYPDGDFPLVTGIKPHFKQFWNAPWAAFIAQLKTEILC